MRWLISLAFILSVASWAEAQVPNQLHYNGYLTNGAGEAINCPDPLQCADQYDIRFRLYDLETGGVVLWEEIHTEVAIYGGSFHIQLGQALPITGAMLEDATWLGITVNDNVEMDPRQQVLSAAYALRAEVAEESVLATNAQELGGVSAAQYALQSNVFSGDYNDLTNRPAGLDDGDNDSLGNLSCATDQVARWNGSAWVCSEAGSSTATVPTAEPGPCTPETAGSMYYDPVANELRICNGSEYQGLTVCSAACPESVAVACGQPRQNGCGANCGGTGTGLNIDQCADPATLSCGGTINDLCSNDCGVTGTALAAEQCDPASVVCGDAVFDTCGNSCAQLGGLCPEGSYCLEGACGNNPWHDANVSWNASGKVFGRYTWDQAGVSNNGRSNGENFCVGRGGTLARPNSQAEWDGIFNNISHDSNGWWIDGHNNFVCGNATVSSPFPYQYGHIFVPTGTSQVYTGCNCTTSEQGLVAYYNAGGSPFDGCQNSTPSGNLGVMDESLDYAHGNIYGFICEH